MKHLKWLKWTTLILVGIFFFLIRDVYFLRSNLVFFVDQKTLVVSSPSGFLRLGQATESATYWIESHQPYFQKKDVFTDRDLQEGALDFGDFQAFYLERGAVYIQTADQTRFFWLAESVDLDLSAIRVSLESDFLFIESTSVADFWPVPKQGLIYLRSNRIPNALETWSRQNQTPFLIPGKSGAFEIRQKEGLWKIFGLDSKDKKN